MTEAEATMEKSVVDIINAELASGKTVSYMEFGNVEDGKTRLEIIFKKA